MIDPLPTIDQIGAAEVSLGDAYRNAAGISFYAVACKEETSALNIFRRALLSSLRQAARNLGFDLVPRAPVSLVIDNTNHAEAGPR